MALPEGAQLRVLLVRPPITYCPIEGEAIPLGLYAAFATRYPPLGLMTHGSLLRDGGHEVALIDAEMEGLSYRALAKRAAQVRPGLIVGSVNMFSPQADLGYLERLGRDLGARVAIRGHFPRLFPDDAMGMGGRDLLGLQGRGWTSEVALADALERGTPVDEVPGILLNRGDEVVHTPLDGPRPSLEQLPFADRSLVAHRFYGTNLTTRFPFTTALSSVGCPYSCLYCIDAQIGYSCRPAEQVVEEMAQLTRVHGIREVAFLDPTFTLSRERTLAICEGLRRRKVDLTFTIRTRPDRVDREVLAALQGAGCVRVSYGIETGDPSIMDVYNRGVMDLDDIAGAVASTSELGMIAFGFFMVGHAGEQDVNLGRTLAFAHRLKLHFAQFMIVRPMPGTAMHEEFSKVRGYDPWQRIGQGHYPSAEELTCHQATLTYEERTDWTRKLYRRFYFDPRRTARLAALPRVLRLPRSHVRMAGLASFQTLRSRLR